MTEKKLHIHFLFNKKVGFLIALSTLVLFFLFNSLAFAISPPTGLNVTAEAPPSRNINLAWNPPSLLPGEAVDYYKVYRALSTITDANKGAADVIAPKVLATIYTDPTGIPGETYYYQVTVVDTLGNESLVSTDVINDHATVSGSENPHDSYSDFSNLCRDCHRIHLAPGSTLVFRRESEKEVCFVCHDETGSPYNIKQLFLYASRHSIEPETEPDGATMKHCHDCHSPHSNKDLRPKLIKDTIRGQPVTGNNNTLCYACHENISYLILLKDAWYGETIYNKTEHYLGGTAALSTYPGTTYATGLCLNCHDPHGSPFNDIRRADKNDLCKACHDDPSITLPATYSYRGMDWYLLTPHYSFSTSVWPDPNDTGAWLTGGATSGECINCHNPHGRNDGTATDTPFKYLLLKWMVGDVTPPVSGYDSLGTDSGEEYLCYGGSGASGGCHAVAYTYSNAGTGGFYGTNVSINIHDLFNPPSVYTTTSPSGALMNTRHDISIEDQAYITGYNYPGKIECDNCHNPHVNNSDYDFSVASRIINPDNRTVNFTNRYAKTNTYLYGGVSYSYQSSPADLDPTFGKSLPDFVKFCLACHEGANNPLPAGVSYGTVVPTDVAYTYFVGGKMMGLDRHGRGAGKGTLKTPYTNGAAYAALNCTDCHEPHGSKGLYHLKERITINGVQMTTATGATEYVVVNNNYGNTGTQGSYDGWCSFCHVIKSHAGGGTDCGSCHYHGGKKF